MPPRQVHWKASLSKISKWKAERYISSWGLFPFYFLISTFYRLCLGGVSFDVEDDELFCACLSGKE